MSTLAPSTLPAMRSTASSRQPGNGHHLGVDAASAQGAGWRPRQPHGPAASLDHALDDLESLLGVERIGAGLDVGVVRLDLRRA